MLSIFAATICLTSPFGKAEVATYGGVVTSWVPQGGEEVFAMARPYGTCPRGAQIHGGLPICWPWAVFEGPDGRKGRIHGVTRYGDWTVKARADDAVTLALEDTEESRRAWPHAFHAELTYRLGRELVAEFRVTNTDRGPYSCTELIHPYFRVGDATRCAVDGLDGARYFWKGEAEKGDRRVWRGKFPGRAFAKGGPGYVFEAGPGKRSIDDPALGRVITVDYENVIKSVVFGAEASFAEYGGADEPDFGRRFLCVEGGTLYRDRAYVLRPGETHVVKATVSVTPRPPDGKPASGL